MEIWYARRPENSFLLMKLLFRRDVAEELVPQINETIAVIPVIYTQHGAVWNFASLRSSWSRSMARVSVPPACRPADRTTS